MLLRRRRDDQPAGERIRRAARLVTIILSAIAVVVGALVLRAVIGGWHGPIGQDLDTYLGFTRSWLDGRGFYLPVQLAGSYVVEDVVGNVYPPVLLYLTVPFALGVPAVLWWAIPATLVTAALWRLQPAWWAWPVLALVFCYPRTWTLLVAGNPAMWSIAFAVAGVAWGWPAVGAALKLTFAPLALIGIRQRSWWIAAGASLVAALPFGAMWVEYVTVLVNGVSSRGFGYIAGEWPIALGLVAVAASGLKVADMPGPSVKPPLATAAW